MLPPSFTPHFLKQLELLRVRNRRAFLGNRAGGHLSLKRGHGLEFSDYRKYELGDHPRSIDWGVYARSERLYVKRFHEEQQLPVLIVLDDSLSMNAVAQEAKWERAKEVCLAFSYVALMQQDSIKFYCSSVGMGPTYHGAKSLTALAKTITSLSCHANSSFDLRSAASSLRFPGVALVVSDFLMPMAQVEKSLNVLRAKNLDVTALQVLGPSDEMPLKINRRANAQFVLAQDVESGQEIEIEWDSNAVSSYSGRLNAHNDALRKFCHGAGINFVTANSSRNIADLVIHDLAKVGLLS